MNILFPDVSGSNLQRKKINLPQDFRGEFNITLIAFQRWQQETIDTWIPFLEELEQKFPQVRYYELPVIQRMNILARTFINEGMRAGIPDSQARARTVTLYLDKRAFREKLGLPHEQDIYILVVSRAGEVLWRGEGAFTPEKGQTLSAALGGEGG